MLVAINGAATRTCTIAPGVASACGVQVTSDATDSAVFDDVTTSGQTRWDAIVLRRNWTSSTASYVIVKGTAAASAPQILPTLNDDPGVLHDQPLALVQITNGQPIPTQVVRLSMVASKVYTASTLAALPAPTLGLYGTEIALVDGSRYRCILDSASSPAWLPLAGNVVELLGTQALTVATGWTLGTLTSRGLKDGSTTTVTFQLRRTGATLNSAAADGNFSDTLICTVVDALRPPDEVPVPSHYWSSGAALLGADVTLTTDGRMILISGVPGQDLITRTGVNDVSIRGSVTFTRKVA
jgi:hypothetical protein